MFHIKIMDHQTNIYDSNNQNYSAAFEELWSESHEPNETEFMMDDLSYYQSPPQAHSAIEPQQVHIERGLAMQKYRLERLQSRGPDYSRSGSLLETVLRHGRNGVTKNYMTMDQARNNINANYNINPTSNLDINSPPYSPECKKSPQSLLPQYFSAQPQTLQNPNIVYGQQQQQPDCHYALNQPPPSMCSTMNANNIISIDTYQSVNTGYNVTSDSKHTVNSDVKPILNTSNSTARNSLEYQWMQSNGTGDGARKRTRQTYSSFQTMELEKEFRDSEYLTKMRRDIVAKKVQLTDRQVKIWYQNRRMKAKKEAKSGFGIIRLSDDKTKIIPLDTNQMSPNNWARIPDADPTSSHVTAPMLQIAESTSMPSQEMMSSENQVQMCQHYDIPEQYTYDLGQAEYLPDKCQRS